MNYIKKYFLKSKYSHIIKHSTKKDLQDNNDALKAGNILAKNVPNSNKAITRDFAKARQNYYSKNMSKAYK